MEKRSRELTKRNSFGIRNGQNPIQPLQIRIGTRASELSLQFEFSDVAITNLKTFCGLLYKINASNFFRSNDLVFIDEEDIEFGYTHELIDLG